MRSSLGMSASGSGARAAARAIGRMARGGNQRAVTQAVELSRQLLSERGEANSLALAARLLPRLLALDEEQRASFFKHLATEFDPDPKSVLDAAQRYAADPQARHLIELMSVAEPPRQELLRRLNRAEGGTSGIVALRRSLFKALRRDPALAAVESDFQHLLSSWFNAGFLQIEQVKWRSSAELLERIIEHEAVHEIKGWTDLRRRLQPDRRCFAFFHPRLPGEPLIFVEVALVPEMPDAIAPLIDPGSAPRAPKDFKVATFYSISNCEPGLKGVSLGNFLIKRVAEELHRECPQIRTFCTLSPIPGFAGWLAEALAGGASPGEVRQAKGVTLAENEPRHAERVRAALAVLHEHYPATPSLKGFDPASAPADVREALEQLAAHYLAVESVTPHGDPVAKFHLGNGARLERINWAADLSAKGIKQSHGLMVNYLYDLTQVEENHERFVHGHAVHSRRVARAL